MRLSSRRRGNVKYQNRGEKNLTLGSEALNCANSVGYVSISPLLAIRQKFPTAPDISISRCAMQLPLRLRRLSARIREFHADESGESSVMSNVMMLAVAALVLIALITFGKDAMKWLKEAWGRITNTQV